MSKSIRLILAALVALPLLALAALYLLVNPTKLAPLFTAQLTQTLNRPASIEGLSFHLFPLSFTATNLVIAEDPAFSREPFLKASSVEIRPELFPLLTGAVKIQSLRVLAPEVELIQNAAGTWNFASLGNQQASGESNLNLALLAIDNARLGLTQQPEPRQLFTDLSAELRNYSQGKPFQLKLSALMENQKAITAEGTIASTADKTTLTAVTLSLANLKGSLEGEVGKTNLSLKLQIPKSPIAEAAPLFLPAGINVKGDIIAAIDIQGTPKQPIFKGRADLTGFEVSGGEIKQPVKTAKLSLAFTPDRITLEPTSISSGSTQLQTFGVVTNYAQQPKLEATLIAPNAQLPELLGIARAYGMSSVSVINATGQATLQIRTHGLLASKVPLEFSGKGSLRNAHIETPSITKPIDIASTDFRFESNSAALSEINAKLGSTTLQGNARVSQFSNPSLAFNLSADKINLNEVRSLFKEESAGKSKSPAKLQAGGNIKIGTHELAELTLTQLSAQAQYRDGHLLLDPLNANLYGGTHSGSMDIDLRPEKPLYTMNSRLEKIESSQFLAAATSLKGIVSGPFAANLQLSFSPDDPLKMARSLNGKLSLNFSQGRIASFNLTNELALLAKFMSGSSSAEKFTQFLGLTGDLEIKSGQATTQNLKLDLANLTASVTGNMNLADQTLDLKLLSILDKRFSEQVGGNKIGGFMTAALANSSGNLLIPASIKGTFAKPIVAPDPGAMAKLKLQSFNPKDPKQMMDSVNSVFDRFRKKKD